MLFLDEMEPATSRYIDGYFSVIGDRYCNIGSIREGRMTVNKPASLWHITQHKGQTENRYVSLVLPRPGCIQIRIEQVPAIDMAVPGRDIHLIWVLMGLVGNQLAVSPELLERIVVIYALNSGE